MKPTASNSASTPARRSSLSPFGIVVLSILFAIFLFSLLAIIADGTPTIVRQICGGAISLEWALVVILRLDRLTAECL